MTIYDQFDDIKTPELSPSEPTSKSHSYFTRKTTRHEDSEHSPLNSPSSDYESPLWWDALDTHHNSLHRYREFLREKVVQSSYLESTPKQSGKMMKTKASSKPRRNPKASLPSRPKQQESHTHIVEVMKDSRDLSGSMEFCFWSMNGCPCQCGKCN